MSICAAMTTPEGRVKDLVKRHLRSAFGDDAYRFMPVQNGMGAPALDFFYCIHGRFVAIETKVEGKSPTPRQEITINTIRRAGGLVFVIHNDDETCRMVEELKRVTG